MKTPSVWLKRIDFEFFSFFSSNQIRYKDRMPPPASSQQFPPTTNPNVIYSGPYSDPGYLQMALGAYLAPSSSVYKSVDPYFLSQGEFKMKRQVYHVNSFV